MLGGSNTFNLILNMVGPRDQDTKVREPSWYRIAVPMKADEIDVAQVSDNSRLSLKSVGRSRWPRIGV